MNEADKILLRFWNRSCRDFDCEQCAANELCEQMTPYLEGKGYIDVKQSRVLIEESEFTEEHK